MKKIFAIVGLFALIFCCFSVVRADGGIMPPPNRWVQETQQKAAIVYEDGLETMVLSMQFQGELTDFGWVIPVPAKPSVEKSSSYLFFSLAELTKNYDKSGLLPASSQLGMLKSETKPVEIIEKKEVGIYDVTTLAASDANALAIWLAKNGFNYPSNKAYILQDYVQDQWYYVAVKIRAEEAQDIQTSQALKEGQATPLKLSFKTDKIVYPLKISSITSKPKVTTTTTLVSTPEQLKGGYNIDSYFPSDTVGIDIYIFAAGKYQIPGFPLNYANWIKKDKVAQLATVDGKPWYQPKGKLYLTAFQRQMKPGEMTEDIYPQKASDNKKVGGNQINYGYALEVFGLMIIAFMLSPLGLLFIIFSLIRRSVKVAGWQLAAAIIQWFTWIITFLLGSIFFATGLSNPSYLGAFSAYIIINVAMLFIVIWQTRKINPNP